MRKRMKKVVSIMMAAAIVFTTGSSAYATETAPVEEASTQSDVAPQETESQTQVVEDATEEGDDVVITSEDKPYLALGSDLTMAQRNTVLALMGIKEQDLDNYEVSYVTNKEEHEYLGDYISSSEIGTRSLSSVVIAQGNKGDGLNISTYNINYCTVGMYKNALATAGISDANIIVAGPFELSGTAALVGILKAYKDMTGEEVDDELVDAAMDELVTTGKLNESIDADEEDVEALIADLKEQLSDGSLDSDEDIEEAISDTAKKYEITLSDEDIQMLKDLLNKLKSLDLDWDKIADQASDWANKIQDVVTDEGFVSKVIGFFKGIVDAIASLFE